MLIHIGFKLSSTSLTTGTTTALKAKDSANRIPGVKRTPKTIHTHEKSWAKQRKQNETH